MKRWQPIIVAIGISLTWNVFGQTESESIRRLREHADAELAARNEAALRKLPPEVAERFRRYKAAMDAATTRIDGKESPELVPYSTRMAVFFAFYGMEGGPAIELKRQLSPADLALLDAFKERYEAAQKEASAVAKKFFMDLGARAPSMSAIEIAAASKANGDRAAAARDALFRSGMQQLSPEGQRIANRWTFDNIRPNHTNIDMMAVALAEPETYKEQFLNNYEWQRKGGGIPPGLENYFKEGARRESDAKTHDPNEPRAEGRFEVGFRSPVAVDAPGQPEARAESAVTTENSKATQNPEK